MLQHYDARNYTDAQGNPSGGFAQAVGLNITWQNGPLGRGTDRKAPNGAFVETVIAIAKQRLEFYQQSKFDDPWNGAAIDHLEQALTALEQRTKDREARNVEGTHQR